jgi:sugar lactone lactonase YvrE
MASSGNVSNYSSSVVCAEGSKKVLQKTLMKVFVVGVVMAICVSVLGVHAHVSARADNSSGNVFATSNNVPLLQFPEGITSWQNEVFVATYNVVTPSNSRIFVFNASSDKLMRTIGGTPGTQLVSSGYLLGLTIDPNTGYLYAANNETGQILQIINPISNNPRVSVYAQYPSGGGPEDLVFYKDGTLFATDSNTGLVYSIPPGGGKANLIIGPSGSGAPVNDNGLLQSPLAGLSPNGIVFSLDWSTLYVANTWSDSVIAFDVNSQGQVVNDKNSPRVFAQNLNYDLEEYPTGFDGLDVPGKTQICSCASTPLNGPDGLALDSNGNIWVASNLGDNLTVLDRTGHVVTTYGTSAVTQGGLMNQPSGMTFIGNTVYSSNLGIFTGLFGSPNLPFQLVSFNVGVSGAGGNGNY